jgi:tetratricopeptide (TPR) repeat protein/tRNA A-37 threonylcarbamoyl transferase component Bud32
MNLELELQSALSAEYRVDRELGAGGMSRVFLVRDAKLNRDIVVKVLPPELAWSLSIDRFQREIRIAASLQHPHIVPVLMAGEIPSGRDGVASPGMPFYAMPFVRGMSLRDYLTNNQRPPAVDALRILRDIARALSYAHRQGVMHRDVKPENVLLTDGVAVVTDFGIAKALSAARIDETDSTGVTLTELGTSLGTPAYMAPEQVSGDPGIDHRADIYALGIVAYELFAGHPPFHGRPRHELLAAQLTETPRRLESVAPDISPAMARLVMRCLEKDPAKRPQTIDEIMPALEAPETGSVEESTRLRRIGVAYSAMFAGAAALAWTATQLIGLPDWILPAAMFFMALGAPLLVVAVRTDRSLGWKQVVARGATAAGGFASVVAVLMGLRAAGIGPGASLKSTGVLGPQPTLLITDFESAGPDSTFGRLATDAVRIALDQARGARVLSPEAVANALRRLRREPRNGITLDVAREIARRDPVSAIVNGSVVRSNERFVITARLLAADSGKVLALASATAAVPDELLGAADRVARKLRERLGESLKDVRRSPPLAQVTTASYEALLKFTAGNRAFDEQDWQKAVLLLKEAVAIDSTFAAAWRRLGAAYSNGRISITAAREAAMRAYRHRDKLTDAERRAVEIRYHQYMQNRPMVLALLDEALIQGDPTVYSPMAQTALSMRQFARGESLQRLAAARFPDAAPVVDNVTEFLVNQGKFVEADSAARSTAKRFPAAAPQVIKVACVRDPDDDCLRRLDSARAALRGPPPLNSLLLQAFLRLQHGQLTRAFAASSDAAAADSANKGGFWAGTGEGLFRSSVYLWVLQKPRNAVDRLDSLGNLAGISNVTAQARLYAFAGRPDRARTLLAALARSTPDSAILPVQRKEIEGAWAAVAFGERRWSDAIAAFKSADRLPEGPVNVCSICLPINLAMTYDSAGMRDSAIAMYERFVITPLWSGSDLKGLFAAGAYERLGILYEAAGDRAKAASHTERFIKLWQSADPILQPRVAQARSRLRLLRP